MIIRTACKKVRKEEIPVMKNTVMHMLEENVRRFPQKTALADEYRYFSYREYLAGALETAKRIGGMICGGEDFSVRDFGARIRMRCRPVGVVIDRSALSVVAFLGIAYSGNFYVPMDPALPAGRLQMILQELDPVMIVDARENPGELPVPWEVPVLAVRPLLEELSIGKSFDAAVYEKMESEEGGDAACHVSTAPGGEDALITELLQEAQILRAGMIDTDPLYAIFTSGSTGVPKGVLVSHRSVLDLTDAFAEAFGFKSDAAFGNQAPFDFDVSVKDIYNALHCGGRVEIVPHRMFVMPAMLMEYLAVRRINTVIWAVSALRIVSDLRALDSMQTSVPVRLRHVMFSGEVMPVKSINYWIDFFPDTVFVNLYGPTEITCNCTYYILDRHFENDEMLPIGRPFVNTRVFLLETAGESEDDGRKEGAAEAGSADGESGKTARIISPSETGVRGEICVEGTGVALGYWNNPVRTAESFTAKPGMPATLNRIYRTGDLGYYNTEGNLLFAARADNQIKHMGHRIELGEIEAALNAIDFIDVAFCFYDQKKEKIVCVYQAVEEQRKAIIAALSDRLPKYMRPNKYLRMEKMPLNAHAKIDRRLIRSMYDEGKL